MRLHALPLAVAALLLLSCSPSDAARPHRARQLLQTGGEMPVCGAGAYYDETEGNCMLCPQGTYQDKDKDIALKCEECGSDKDTCCAGSRTSGACFPTDSAPKCPPAEECPEINYTGPNGIARPFEAHTCPAGYFKDPAVNGCTPCPAGTYMSSENTAPECMACATNTTNCCTKNTDGSSCTTIRFNRRGEQVTPRCSRQQCTTYPVWCPLGHYFDKETEVCTLCAVGTHNDNPTAERCGRCGPELTTCCEGSITSAECVLTDELFPKGKLCNFQCPFN